MFKDRKQEFLDLFYRQIFPYIAQGEKTRKNEIIKAIIKAIGFAIMISGPCWIGYIIGYYLKPSADFGTHLGSIGLCIFAALMGILAGLFKSNKDFKRSLKDKYMNGIISYFNGMRRVNVENSDYPILQKIKRNPLFANDEVNQFSVDDIFNGNYNNIDYTLFEIQFLDYVDKKTRKFLQGIAIELNLKNLTFDEITIVSNSMRHKQPWFDMYCAYLTLPWTIISIIWFCIFYKDHFIFTICNLILSLGVSIFAFVWAGKSLKNNKFRNLDDLKINNRFCVNSKNIPQAEKIAKPELFDILQNIGRVFNSKNIALNTYKEYENTKAMIIIETKKDAFEFGSLYRPLNKPESMSKFFNQLSSIMDLIDYFANIEKESRD